MECLKCHHNKCKSDFYLRSNGKTAFFACKECVSKIRKQNYQKTRDSKLIYAKEYRENNRDTVNIAVLKWHDEHPNWKKEWKAKNKEHIKEYARKYVKNKKMIDPLYKLKKTLRSRIGNILYDKVRYGKSIDLLGCSYEDYMKYLENKFLEGMSWNNHGEWHIDHILPCDSFDLTKEEEQKKCFHYSNTQPLWAIDNLIKNNRILV